MSARVEQLVARLEKGRRKTEQIFGDLSPAQWETVVYEEPTPWTMRNLLAHFLSAEEGLRRIAQNVAAGGPGAPKGLDYDAFNATEQQRLADVPPGKLLADLEAEREQTIAWVRGLEDAELDRVGHHPALGEVTLETLLNAIYGHQLMHVRDLKAVM
jgi:hypothetical protein